MLALLLTLLATATPQADCKTAFGQTACGYDCTAAFGQVACADHPLGRCEAAFGKVVCGPDLPTSPLIQGAPATCKAAFGQIACGWDCTAAFGQVACADRPWGSCKAAFGEVVCTREGPRVQPVLGPGGVGVCAEVQGVVVCDRTATGAVVAPGRRPGAVPARPQATCESAFGQTACGYDCKAAFGQVACARTPQGRCEAAAGQITCWDPPR